MLSRSRYAAVFALSAFAVLFQPAAAAGSAPYTYKPNQARIPACANAGKALPLPAGFPRNFPLPPHSAITFRQTGGTGVKVSGFVPIASITAGRKFFLSQLPKAGFKVFLFDTEPGVEVESEFQG